MQKLKIEDKKWIETIARHHEYYLEQREVDYNATRMSIALRQEMIVRRLQYSDDVIYVEHDSNGLQLIAFIWGHYERSFDTVITEMLYTSPHFRGKGYATQLKRTLERWAITQGASSIEGTVDAKNDEMIHINKARGYEVSHLKMRKDLR
ncbi:GNAT family N-acetyltransferase [Staphylococcus sp. NRL 16/872]|uniref:GNAT family N-acetyltransferase n=1 Tax=Staphylococcus sp. NRL 16/872 TaxID=2930131 RepID=UPI001FB56063|nr:MULTISPECIES: GNAT family N-acetyltransferase [unclassified Staphylococcus]MCJ1656965.1 GNAT family N-acetyltransferase [Staphylococcus sp. NRL 21/187]MCJ1668819.1 GNAT family N-acetyltransferase [Staphylococcus sp. NRL 19/737]WEN69036.1 GNAT family N-acetyltransferase [Staphylococcus sp. NRL 16/872]